MVIIRADKADVPEIYRLYREEMNQGHNFEPITYKLDDFYEYVNDPRTILLVYREEEKTVGFIVAYDFLNWAYIDIVCVNSKHRGKSIGSALIEHLFKMKSNWDCIEACYYSDDLALEKFFKKNNFKFNNKPTIWVAKTK